MDVFNRGPYENQNTMSEKQFTSTSITAVCFCIGQRHINQQCKSLEITVADGYDYEYDCTGTQWYPKTRQTPMIRINLRLRGERHPRVMCAIQIPRLLRMTRLCYGQTVAL